MTAPVSRQATDLTNHVFQRAATGDFHAAAQRVDAVLAEVRAQAYEAGLTAARRETGAAAL
jgi:hypothetical protein